MNCFRPRDSSGASEPHFYGSQVSGEGRGWGGVSLLFVGFDLWFICPGDPFFLFIFFVSPPPDAHPDRRTRQRWLSETDEALRASVPPRVRVVGFVIPGVAKVTVEVLGFFCFFLKLPFQLSTTRVTL